MTAPVASVPARSVKPLYLTAGASGLLLYASFFPLNAGFLAWFALVPLLFLIRSNARPRHIYLAAFFGGLVFYVPAIQWMRVAHIAMYGTWLALSIYSALYFPIGLWVVRRLDRARVPLSVAIPCVWVGCEYMRAHFPTGFSWLESTGFIHRIGFGWYFMGYTQHDYLPIIQIADIAGVYGVTFLIVMVNAVLYLWVSRAHNVDEASLLRSSSRRSKDASFTLGNTSHAKPLIGTVAVAALIASTIVYGYSRLDHAPFPNGPRVALLQSNVPQSVKMGLEGENQLDKHMTGLLRTAINVPPSDLPDLVIWPETTFSKDWYDLALELDPLLAPSDWQKAMGISRKNAQIITEYTRGSTNQLLGLTRLERDADGREWKYNSALFVGRDGWAGPRYDKMHLVPFGEYVPLRNTFPWMKTFTPYKGDYSCKPGEHWTRFPLPVKDTTYHFGCLICYEDSDPALARRYALPSPEGPAVDFLVNISNDGWFNGTEEHEQHLAICRFRAIECRRSIVRAVNMGISGIIDSDGRIVQIPGNSWSESKKIAAIVNGLVPLDNRDSIFARWGDWLPIGCWGLVAIGLVLAFFPCNRP